MIKKIFISALIIIATACSSLPSFEDFAAEQNKELRLQRSEIEARIKSVNIRQANLQLKIDSVENEITVIKNKQRGAR